MIPDKNGNIALQPDHSGPTVRLGAVGDLAFHGKVLETMLSHSPGFVFEPVRDQLGRQDVLVGNLESVLLDFPYSPLGEKAKLISGVSALTGLKKVGFNVLTFANNHIMDAGDSGFLECLARTREAGFAVSGAGQDLDEARIPATLEKEGLTFRFFSYSYRLGQIAGKNNPGCCEARLDRILEDVREFSEPTDIRIVSLHVDAEFEETPDPDRLEFCRALADSGIQAVLCHHPHVPQGIEVHNGSVIAYSLGNFVFPVSAYMLKNSEDNSRSFILQIEFSREGPVNVQVEPVLIDDLGRPVPAVGRERDQLLEMIHHRSAKLHDHGLVRANYRRMTRTFTRDVLRNTYWALGERDWKKLGLIWGSFRVTPTKRKWVRDYLMKR